jgi:transposase
MARGLTAQRIWQDLVEEHGFAHGYESVKRFIRNERKRRPEVVDVLEHPPGKEGQVDYFEGPPTLDASTGRWRRPWVFRMTLCCSRHGYEEPMWGQNRLGFLRAHENAFLHFGGVPEVIRHDNLKAAVVRACLYDPTSASSTPPSPATGALCPCPHGRTTRRRTGSRSAAAATSRATR